jgi:hypothetical protein
MFLISKLQGGVVGVELPNITITILSVAKKDGFCGRMAHRVQLQQLAVIFQKEANLGRGLQANFCDHNMNIASART